MVDFITNGLLIYQGTLTNTESGGGTTPGLGASTVVPTGKARIILEIIACNVGATATFELSVVPSAGTAGHANRILHTYSVTNGLSATFSLYTYMAAGSFLSGIASANDNITLTISGIEKSV